MKRFMIGTLRILRNTLCVMCLFFTKSFSQDSHVVPGKSESTYTVQNPQYVVVLEVIPDGRIKIDQPINTAIFEIPVSKEYYESVKDNQEVMTWFRTNGETSTMGNFGFPGNGPSRWKLMVRDKRIVTNMNIKGDLKDVTEDFTTPR